MQFWKFSFEIVDVFKYFGLHFYANGSDKNMIKHVILRAKKLFGWFISTVNKNGWTNLNLRLVLMEVYVRSLLQCGCSVWTLRYLLNGIGKKHSIIKPILVL